MTEFPVKMNPRTETPKGLRLHIGLFGKRNAGKSSLMNALLSQDISIVSPVAGTTTDPVEKAAEFAPLGPVVFIDTAGIDDTGSLGEQRTERSKSVFSWMDLALIVTTADTFGEVEEDLIAKACKQSVPSILVFNKIDSVPLSESLRARAQSFKIAFCELSAQTREGVEALRALMVRVLSTLHEPDPDFLSGLVKPGDTVVLVTPIDTGAPKGRLILPQVQAVRSVLDADAQCVVVRENRLAQILASLKTPPAFVMTDSQVVRNVVSVVPENIPVTTFSIEMSVMKSDLTALARGAAVLTTLKPGDRVMICETCSHHPQPDDIGRKKIPRWLAQTIGGPLKTDVVVGKDFPSDLTPYKIIIQCGGCVVTRRHMLARLRAAQEQNVPMTNYGIAISFLQGVLTRALSLHPQALEAYNKEKARLQGLLAP